MAIYFGAGPAALPKEVLEEASKAIINYKNSGLSILEIPHRDALFDEIITEASTLSKELLGLGDDYDALWLQGGGRLQFSMIPMNFLADDKSAGYIDSGHWADEAIKAANLYGTPKILGSSAKDNYTYIPEIEMPTQDLSYLYFTSNNTIYGTQFEHIPAANGIPLIADMSSELYSRQWDYNKLDIIFAVAQKNIGPAGVTLILGKKDLLNTQVRSLPGMLSYKDEVKNNSLLNTPPVFAIYCSLLVLRWVKQMGLATLEAINDEKAQLLYDTIDNSKLFYGVAEKSSRSKMNVCFRAHDLQKEEAFNTFAQNKGILGIKGHRSVGGFRASIYNAVSLEDVKELVATIQEFEHNNG